MYPHGSHMGSASNFHTQIDPAAHQDGAKVSLASFQQLNLNTGMIEKHHCITASLDGRQAFPIVSRLLVSIMRSPFQWGQTLPEGADKGEDVLDPSTDVGRCAGAGL
eukprot:5646861-Amphidinium_carterae.1